VLTSPLHLTDTHTLVCFFINHSGYCVKMMHKHAHSRLTTLCPRLPGWAGTRMYMYLHNFMLQGKITEADTPTILLDATPSRLLVPPLPSSTHFYAGCPSCRHPSIYFGLGQAPSNGQLRHIHTDWFTQFCQCNAALNYYTTTI